MDLDKYQDSLKILLPCRWKTRKDNTIPLSSSGLWCFLSYGWLDKFMWGAFRSGVDCTRSWKCSKEDRAELNYERLEYHWSKEVRRHGARQASLFRVFLRFLRTRLIVTAIVLLISLILFFFLVAYLLPLILKFNSRVNTPLVSGVLVVLAMFVCDLLHSLLFTAVFTIATIGGSRLRAGALLFVYRKLLRISCLQNKTIGQVVNLFANDGQRLLEGAINLPMLLCAPLLGVATTAFCVYLLGPWALVGTLILCCLLPLQVSLGRLTVRYRSRAMTITDRRVRIMAEILAYAKFVKMYSWEKPFAKLLGGIRVQEKSASEKSNITTSVAFSLSAVLVALATVSTLIAYRLSGQILFVNEVFTYLVLHCMILEKLELGTQAVKSLSEFRVASRRFQEILQMEEVCPKLPLHRYNNKESCIYAVELNHMTSAWPDLNIQSEHHRVEVNLNNGSSSGDEKLLNVLQKAHSYTIALKNIDLKVEKGDIVGIVGTVGSGKSALLRAILGQMRLLQGEIVIHGRLAYVPQQAWIFNASLRDNIIFGRHFNADRYQATLEACCLLPDIEVLPAGDMTEIGERGINLSGGQKQRVSLARALYSDRDILLLDDPLSAVDPDVSDQIYRGVIQGLLVGRTVLLVTHQINYFPECDYIVHIHQGRITEQGTHEELVEAGDEYSHFIDNFHDELDKRNHERSEKERKSCDSHLEKPFDNVELEDEFLQGTRSVKKRSTIVALGRNLIGTEERERGATQFVTYKAFMGAAGGCIPLLIVLLVYVLAELSRIFSYLWLSKNVENHKPDLNSTSEYEQASRASHFCLVYAGSVFAIILFFSFRSVVLMKVLMLASSQLHNNLLARIFRCPVKFFDTTPLGRVMNRFTKDIDELDSRLPPLLDQTLQSFVAILLYSLLLSFLLPWLLLAILPLTLLSFALYNMFRVAVKDLKRSSSVAMSPILSHVANTVEGLHTIRAYDKTADYISCFTESLNQNCAVVLLFYCCMRWMSVRLGVLTSSILGTTTLLVVLLRDTVPADMAGLAVLYAAQIMCLYHFLVRSAAETEAKFTSVERLRAYTEKLDCEGPKIVASCRPPPTWPSQGHIRFDHYQLRYRPGLPLVLREFTIEILPRERIGIVGRTGSGKSSIAVGLFRLVEPSSGKIEIDGIDICRIGLEDLRGKLFIIPQDPVLFAGTLRSNLDPHEAKTDKEIWEMIEKCHIRYLVESLECGLEAPVLENGDNFSMGERQLLCMVRALLYHPRILILDEATAAIDRETEAVMQRVLRDTLNDCTLLIIAHRLQSIADCDRILVMEDGKVLEFDKPAVLLANPDSRFSHMMSVCLDTPGLSLESLDTLTTEAWV